MRSSQQCTKQNIIIQQIDKLVYSLHGIPTNFLSQSIHEYSKTADNVIFIPHHTCRFVVKISVKTVTLVFITQTIQCYFIAVMLRFSDSICTSGDKLTARNLDGDKHHSVLKLSRNPFTC